MADTMTLEKILQNHLNLSEEKARHLLSDLEKISWVYSSNPIKRSFGVWANAIAAYIMFVMPFLLLGLLSSWI
jgi:hypothetical protein